MAWRPLGYVYDLSILENQSTEYTKNKNNPRGIIKVKMERYQTVIKAVLVSVVKCQKSGALDNILLMLINQTETVNLKIPVIFIVGDIQGGNKLCGVTVAYGNTLECPCQKYNVKDLKLATPI